MSEDESVEYDEKWMESVRKRLREAHEVEDGGMGEYMERMRRMRNRVFLRRTKEEFKKGSSVWHEGRSRATYASNLNPVIMRNHQILMDKLKRDMNKERN